MSHPSNLALEGSEMRATGPHSQEPLGTHVPVRQTDSQRRPGGGYLAYSSLLPFRLSADSHCRGHHCWHPHPWHGDRTDLHEVWNGNVPVLGRSSHRHDTLVPKHTRSFPGKRREVRRGFSETTEFFSYLLIV